MRYTLIFLVTGACLHACAQGSPPDFDYILRQGTIYDGSGRAGYVADIGIQGDTISAIGDLSQRSAREELDVTGLAVAPGFINMLSWADRSLLMDGRSMSDIKQGVTLEVFGEGWSPAPVKRKPSQMGVDSLWTTLAGYFAYLSKKGITPNVASFVGATSVRIHELGYEKRAPTPEELLQMQRLVREAMEEGAMGVSSSLIYPPADYANTGELIALAQVAASYGGLYATHMRSEGDFILPALRETLTIAREAQIPVEIYHLKVNLSRNWQSLDDVLITIDSARRVGLRVTANSYPYIASATGLTARMPNWVQEGGAVAMRKRLRDPGIRNKVLYEMRNGIPYKNSDPSDVQLLGFRLDSLNLRYRGKRLDEVARMRGTDPDQTVLDLVTLDKSPVAAIYYQQSEANVRRVVQMPYVSFGSDGASMSDDPVFAEWGTHPRAYGTFARVLGKYVRDEKILTLEEAIRKMTLLPASNLKIADRGRIASGYFADLAIFDPSAIKDVATFEDPKQYALGMVHVFVNGVPVLRHGEHTQALPGKIVYGPGYKKNYPEP